MMHSIQRGLLTGLVLLAATTAIQAGIITPIGASDAVVNRDWGNGFSASMWVTGATSPVLGVDYDPSDSDYRYWRVAELQFPIDGLAGMSDLTGELSLYVTNPGSGTMQVRYLGNATGTVAAQNIFNSGTVLNTFPANVSGWHSFDVSDELQQSVDAGHQWVSFMVRSADWWHNTGIAASEDPQGLSPVLNVVPEPTTLALSVLALLLVGLRRRRR